MAAAAAAAEETWTEEEGKKRKIWRPTTTSMQSRFQLSLAAKERDEKKTFTSRRDSKKPIFFLFWTKKERVFVTFISEFFIRGGFLLETRRTI